MFHRYGVVAAAATLLFTGASYAQTLAPVQSQSVTLGSVNGGVYYTTVPKGDRVVATLQCNVPPCIVRFIATLTPGQSMTLSTPRGVGEPPIIAQIERHGDQLVVENGGRRVAKGASVAADAP